MYCRSLFVSVYYTASDKSATSIQFTPGSAPETAENQDDEEENQLVIIDEATPIFLEGNLPQPIDKDIKTEPAFTDDAARQSTILTLPSSMPVDENSETADEFREKIKKRLQKALLGKKKQ